MSTRTDDFNQIDVLSAQGLWAVVYQNKAINLRTQTMTIQGEVLKYTRTAYPSPAPARILAKKLNTKFMTTDFTVVKIL